MFIYLFIYLFILFYFVLFYLFIYLFYFILSYFIYLFFFFLGGGRGLLSEFYGIPFLEFLVKADNWKASAFNPNLWLENTSPPIDNF